MQKRLVRKKDLEMLLSEIGQHPSPRPNLEQYTISDSIAATTLYLAAYTYNDIVNKTVLDLGCGTGKLALGAAFLGAERVVGVDIDKVAVRAALQNSKKTCLDGKVEWFNADISAICGDFDTVVQNPPFGVQKNKADRKFLKKALETGNTVYSFHKSSRKDRSFIKKLKTSKNKIIAVSPSAFIERFVEEHNGRVKVVYTMLMVIPHMFSFHRKRRHEFLVDLYVLQRK